MNVLDFPERRKIESEAAEWLIVLDRDLPPTIEERQRLQKWLNKGAAYRKALDDLAELWGQMNILTQLAVDIESPKTPALKSVRFPERQVQRIVAAAACLVLVVAVAFLVPNNTASISDSNGYYATAVGDQSQEILQDGSSVYLNTDSQIEVEYTDQYRDIYLLQGEAHFTVAHNPEIPFRVFAGNGRIYAVGTAFSVHVLDEDVDVLVSEGIVSLASTLSHLPTHTDQDSGAVDENAALQELGLLEEGQFATIAVQHDENSDTRSGRLLNLQSLSTDEVSDQLSWRQGLLTFTGHTLGKVVAEIDRYTTVQIDLDPSVKTMRVGGKFPVGDTDMMFAALESSFGLQVSWVGPSHVLISDREF
jgi:transmembrane sensor